MIRAPIPVKEEPKYYLGDPYYYDKPYRSKSNGQFNLRTGDHIFFRYKIMNELGRGAYGTVIKAYDYKHNSSTAIKIIRSENKFYKPAEREIRILNEIKKFYYENINNSELMDFMPLFIRKTFRYKNHICMVFDMYDTNLYHYTKNNNKNIKNSKLISRDILKGLAFLKRMKIMHADLKPENVMLKNRYAIIIDYGLSNYEDKFEKTNYMQSRYYRSPEVYYGLDLTCAIDMWSFGCMVYEMYYGVPLFGGKNENDMIRRYHYALGFPPKQYINEIYRRRERGTYFYRKDGSCKISETGIVKRYKLEESEDEDIIMMNNLIKSCLKYIIEKRFEPRDALLHKFYEGLGNENFDSYYEEIGNKT